MGIYTKKESVTGWYNEEHEIQRFYNLSSVQLGSKKYLPKFGLDWALYLNPSINFSVDIMSSHATQKATEFGIRILDIKSRIEKNHTMAVAVSVQGLEPVRQSVTNMYFNV